MSETLELFSTGGTIRSLKARKNLQLINKLMSLSQTAFQFLAASFCSPGAGFFFFFNRRIVIVIPEKIKHNRG